MDATINDKEMSEDRESRGSCNSFVDGTFTDDTPSMRQLLYSRSYCRNRFSSHALASSTTMAIILAVYLLLPLGCQSTIMEANQTSPILANRTEEYVLNPTQDVDNEIAAALDDNPINAEEMKFLETSLTENLEDTIRSSVKTEIEMEQNVGSPALINAYNVLPETENIVVVEYPGASTIAPKNEQPPELNLEKSIDIQCDASALDCLRPQQQELPASTAVEVIINISNTTAAPEIAVLSTTLVVPTTVPTVDPIVAETTLVPESTIPLAVEQNEREGRKLESAAPIQTTVEEPITTVDNKSEVLNGSLLVQPEKNTPEVSESQPSQKQTITGTISDVLSNANSTSVATNSNESESSSESAENVSVSSSNNSTIVNQSSESSESLQNETKGSETVALNTAQEKDEEQPMRPDGKVLAETVPGISISSLTNANATIHVSSENSESASQPQETENLPTDSNPNSDNELQQNSNDSSSSNTSHETPIQQVSDTENFSINNGTAIINNNEQEVVVSQAVSGSISSSSEPTPSTEPPQSSEPPPSSEHKVEQLSDIAGANETLTIIFEEPLVANETTVPQVDDYMKTIIEMEDPVLVKSQVDNTTIHPETPIHTVIKKQGVESIDIEEPIDVTADGETELKTLSSSIPNKPSEQAVSEEKPVQQNKQLVANETQLSEQSESTIEIAMVPNLTAILPAENVVQDIAEVSVVFPGKSDDDASLNGKGSRSINALQSPLIDPHKPSINFDVYPAGQTFNGNLAEELPNGIGKALPTHRLSESTSNRSTLIIALCSGTALLFIVVSVTFFLVSFQRQHGTLDIEMQERRDNVNEDEVETCIKLIEVELPSTSLALQTDAEAEIEECL